MARTRTLQSLIDDARARADMFDDPNVTDADLTLWINQGIAELWDMLAKADPDQLYLSTTITTISGEAEYVVPADFYQVRGVDVVVNGTYYPLPPLTFQERIGPSANMIGFFGEPMMRYQVRRRGLSGASTRLFLDPPPRQVYSVVLHYVQSPPLLVATTDVFDGSAGWEDYPVIFAASVALERQERSSAAQRADLAKLQKRITSMAAMKDHGEEPRIADVRGRGRGRMHRW